MHAAAALLYFGPLHTYNRRREKPAVEEKCHRSYLLFSRVKNNVCSPIVKLAFPPVPVLLEMTPWDCADVEEVTAVTVAGLAR